MPVVTAVIPSPKRPGRFDVLADGQPYVTLSIESIEVLRLGTGTPIDERLDTAARREAEIVRVQDRALSMLASRGRARAEVQRLLVRKGEEAPVVDAALDRLARAGLLDDAQFARQFTRSKALGAGMSRRRLRQELSKRGVDADASADAIDEVFEEEQVDDKALVERAAQKKLRTLTNVDEATRKRRLYGYLARRGFEVDEIARVMASLTKGGAEEREQ